MYYVSFFAAAGSAQSESLDETALLVAGPTRPALNGSAPRSHAPRGELVCRGPHRKAAQGGALALDGCYTREMPLTARVQNGQLVLDEPTELPEGSVFTLVPVDEVFDKNDDLTDEERAHVHAEIIASIRERKAGGETFDADEVMAELAARP